MISLLSSTARALGITGNDGDFRLCNSRSLRLTRYARPDLDDESTPTRKDYLQKVVSASRDPAPSRAFLAWQATLPGIRQIHARLEARLLINVSGSVMENAGLNLDRYGIAHIPGSAVKGCARRAAIATLRQWCETSKQPVGEDLLASIATPFNTAAELHLAILRVFGCTDLEWQGSDATDNDGNDLAWACGPQWPALRDAAREVLNAEAKIPGEPAPTRRGTVAFLPAYPARLPDPDLELDVLTPHHKEYYEGKREVALDNEGPVPIFFPAGAAGADYTFALFPLGIVDSALLGNAADWLRVGLTTFGLGAKNNAGYGWFKDITAEVGERMARENARSQAEAAAKAAEAKRLAERAARKEREAARSQMSPAERADADLADRSGDWGWMKPHLVKFAQHPPEQQAAILRWFADRGRKRWEDEIKPDAKKGKKPWSQIISSIHAAKNALKIDLP